MTSSPLVLLIEVLHGGIQFQNILILLPNNLNARISGVLRGIWQPNSPQSRLQMPCSAFLLSEEVDPVNAATSLILVQYILSMFRFHLFQLPRSLFLHER